MAYTSSIGIYGPNLAEFPEPTTHYGSFKLASEGVARAFYEEHGIHPWESGPLWFMVLEGKLVGAPGRP